jgi:hypothetical protein
MGSNGNHLQADDMLFPNLQLQWARRIMKTSLLQQGLWEPMFL